MEKIFILSARLVLRLQFALDFEVSDSLNCWQGKFVIEVEQNERRMIPAKSCFCNSI